MIILRDIVLSITIALIVTGSVLLKANGWLKKYKKTGIDDSIISKIGFFSYTGLVPVVPVSEEDIIVESISEKIFQAISAKFCFFPVAATMFGLAVKKSFDYYKIRFKLRSGKVKLLIMYDIVPFMEALSVTDVGKHRFNSFGWYRVVYRYRDTVGIPFYLPLIFIQ